MTNFNEIFTKILRVQISLMKNILKRNRSFLLNESLAQQMDTFVRVSLCFLCDWLCFLYNLNSQIEISTIALLSTSVLKFQGVMYSTLCTEHNYPHTFVIQTQTIKRSLIASDIFVLQLFKAEKQSRAYKSILLSLM